MQEKTEASSGAAPAAGRVRKGRGNFTRQLRTEEMERQQKEQASAEASAVNTTAPLILPTTIPNQRPAHQTFAAPEDEVAAPDADKKKAIPLENPVYNFDDRAHYFGTRTGETPVGTHDTIRQVIFRGEKRRRYCLIVGDLQGVHRQVTLKLFGHKGWKPLHLQDKLIRLVNLSIGKPRLHHFPDEEEGAEEGSAAHNADGEAAAGAAAETEEKGGEEGEKEGEGSAAAEEQAPAEAEGAVPPAPLPVQAAPGRAPPAMDDFFAEPKKQHVDPARHNAAMAADYEMPADDDDLAEFDDTNLAERMEDDEVVPLQVETEAAAASGMMHESSLSNSAVLTSRYFRSLEKYFKAEFAYLLSMEDIAAQNVTVQVSVGAAYCCLARRGSHSTQLKHATFGEFVERMNEESMQMYFLRDCPASISHGVNVTAGNFHNEAEMVQVKIFFFSNERQSRSVARALWDTEENGFRLMDMENVGVSFNWTVFSLDETNAMQKRRRQMGYTPAELYTDFIRKKTVAYPFEVEFRSFKRWKQHEDHPAAPLAEAILERLSIAEQNRQHHGSSFGYEKMDLSYVCEIDNASDDINVERIVVEHTKRGRVNGTDLTLDNTTSLHIESFAAARQLLSRVIQYGPEKVAEMQNVANNNYVRGRGRYGGRGGGRGGLPLAPEELDFNLDEVLRPANKLTFFRSRGSVLHWKIHVRSPAEVDSNVAPIGQALNFMESVLDAANEFERNSSANPIVAPRAL